MPEWLSPSQIWLRKYWSPYLWNTSLALVLERLASDICLHQQLAVLRIQVPHLEDLTTQRDDLVVAGRHRFVLQAEGERHIRLDPGLCLDERYADDQSYCEHREGPVDIAFHNSSLGAPVWEPRLNLIYSRSRLSFAGACCDALRYCKR